MAPGLLDIALLTVFGFCPLGRHCVQVHLAYGLLGPKTCPPSAQSTLHGGLPTLCPVYLALLFSAPPWPPTIYKTNPSMVVTNPLAYLWFEVLARCPYRDCAQVVVP